jgi:prolyl-tRNA editing enzyme YbaK/EbsC (Cys-tRNA(Pro) deacylase)
MNKDDKNLSKSANVVQEALLKKGFELKVVELPSSTRTAKEAAETLGCTVDQIVKSLLFCSEKTNQPVLVLASGTNRVNEVTIEKIIGEKIVKADANFTRAVTGFAIGGVPPIGHKQIIPHIFIDEDLLKLDQLWAAAGTPNAVFSLHSRDLLNLIDGRVVAINPSTGVP